MKLFIAVICLTALLNTFSVIVSCKNLSNRVHLETRIVGGKTIGIQFVPYQVALLIRRQLICGGSIISKQFVLTSGEIIKENEDLIGQIRINFEF